MDRAHRAAFAHTGELADFHADPVEPRLHCRDRRSRRRPPLDRAARLERRLADAERLERGPRLTVRSSRSHRSASSRAEAAQGIAIRARARTRAAPQERLAVVSMHSGGATLPLSEERGPGVTRARKLRRLFCGSVAAEPLRARRSGV
ncbi:MAG: hypothetical protein AVDCRST_MAG17-714 [uncultured Solirubrobacterales bacterium]|uniref:Uncharacterized protein n=1 Tax=uncultured Solirubrobacterales bacterium TaxID=768556 RepID=A0A6J4S9W0_9ACTN|nr:MAG: hypothetical protein AVDCRST_MAG17-714 [uncultured Solirubrobacterales bacterium]